MKKALVMGTRGFIGHHLMTRLKDRGYWVRGVDTKGTEFGETTADEFLMLNLREKDAAETAFAVTRSFDDVYALAADMGGMGSSCLTTPRSSTATC